jgi:sulfatase maturation enzyme AslB (radical SAM superfamily)
MSGDQEGMAQLAALQAKVTQFIGGDATMAYELLNEQLRTAPDDDAVRALMQTNQETIDYTFFDIFIELNFLIVIVVALVDPRGKSANRG